MIEEAQERFERGDYAGAYDLYQKMLDDEPENHEVLFMMSLCRQRQQNLPQAADLLSQALLYYPTQALYHYTLGGVRLRQGLLGPATESFQQAAQLNPNYADAHVALGYVRLIQQQYEPAEAALRAALRANPRVPAAHAHLGVVYLATDRVEEALQMLRESAEMFPDDAYTQTHLGRAFMRTNMPAFAAQCFTNALKQNEKEPSLWLWLGQSLAASHQDQEAVDALRRCLDYGGESAEALYALAQIYQRQGEPAGAWNLLSRVIRLQPQAVEPRLLAAQACRELQRYEVAEDILQACVDDQRARKLLTRLALDQEDTKKARGHLAALSLAGSEDTVSAILHAESALQAGDWPQMEKALKPVLAEDRINPSAILLESQRQYFTGDAKSALDTIQSLDEQAQATIADEAQDWTVRLLHECGQVAAAWELARHNPQRRPSILAALDEGAPEGVASASTASIEAGFDKDLIWSWPVRGPNDNLPDPILVYGWPGSVREALLSALVPYEQVKVLRDPVTLQDERRAAICWPQGGEALSALDDASLRLQRKRYWREVRRLLPKWQDQTVVDALWFSAASLPSIYRLFPTAKIIVLDHSLDSLKMDWAMSAYADVAAMASTWEREQHFLKQALDVLPLQWITINHQQLMQDGEATLQALVQFLPGLNSSQLAARINSIYQRQLMPNAPTAEDQVHIEKIYAA